MSEPQQPSTEALLDRGGFKDLVTRANSGDAEALQQLRNVLDANPHIWHSLGDLAEHAQRALISLIAGDNRLTAESLIRKVEQLKTELAGPAASTLERLGAERIVSCWLQAQYLDMQAIRAGGTLANANFVIKAQDQAHRRYLTAVKSLAVVRQLMSKDSRRTAQTASPDSPATIPMDQYRDSGSPASVESQAEASAAATRTRPTGT